MPSLITNKRLLHSMAIFIIAIACLIYGISFHRIDVLTKEASNTITDDTAENDNLLELPEMDVLRDITVGGITHLDTGNLQRTYGLDEKPAELCPT